MPFSTLWAAGLGPDNAAGVILTGTVHPQGVQDAPGGVGSLYINLTNGQRYRKLGGGTTAFGWYLEPDPLNANYILIQGRFASGAQNQSTVSPNALAYAGNCNVNIPTRPAKTGSATYFANDRLYTSGFTSTALNNIGLWKCSGTIDAGFPYSPVGGAALGPTELMPWDFSIDVITTPRDSPAGVGTTLADMRAWIAILAQNGAGIQASGAMGNVDLIYTGFPTVMAVNGGLYGVAWRFSTAAGDTKWTLCTANDNGAVAAQTATPIGANVAADTTYRLRARLNVVAGVPTVFASVDDGTETAITLNVGPGTTPAVKTNIPIIPYMSIQNLNNALLRKSFGWARCSMFFAKGCE